MKKLIVSLSLTLIAALLYATPTYAAGSTLTMSLNQTLGRGEPIVTLFGQIKPARANVPVTVQVFLKGQWQDTGFSTKSHRVGTWSVVKVATALDANLKYRAMAEISGKMLYSTVREIVVKQTPEMFDGLPITVHTKGPGGRIHGSDVSRWQHPNDKPINFVKKYKAGLRFVMIKASDTRDESDALALKYVIMDRAAAQAAGIYTGFYHYAKLPNSRDLEVFKADATAQAEKVLWRLASLGGYNEMDLPYALDLENNCIEYNSLGCSKYATKKSVTLWAKTFLRIVKERTGRTPILYSYPSFLEGAMVRDAELATYPLWLAQYGVDPAIPTAEPGLKPIGCYVHSWTSPNCTSQWVIWQYTSCGIAPKYGVPGNRLDLNVFRGSQDDFLALAKGTWTPAPGDFMPKNETSTISITSVKASSTNENAIVKVEVFRPTGLPVVTGTVRFYFNAKIRPEVLPAQSVTRSSSGAWTLTIKGLPEGTWPGQIGFIDATGTHAKIRTPIEFVITQGPTPSPSPSPTKQPVKPKPATDGCAKQIKN
jgi:lysozyme|uniref:glycoside hydrolase family 25 protein n=2 Tax=Candidatus Planktophila sp. TaxID=2175601 RepID=UPI00404A8074